MNQKQAARMKALVTAMKEKQQALQNNFSTSGYQAWIAACDAVENYIVDITVPDNPVGDFYSKHLEVIGNYTSLSADARDEYSELPKLMEEFHGNLQVYIGTSGKGLMRRLASRELTLTQGKFISGYIRKGSIDTAVEISKYAVAINSVIEYIRNE